MDLFMIWEQSLLTAWQDLSIRFLTFLPVFLGAILVFTLGVIISGWAYKLTEKLLRTLRFSQLTKTSGVDAFLKKADIQYDSAVLVAQIVRWFVLLVFFVATVNILGLGAITVVLNELLAYIPRIFAAALIVAAGVFLANVVEGLVRGALATVDHSHARQLAKMSRWLVTLVAVMAAINELKVAEALVQTFFQGLTWTVTLAIGLAVGLGSKDLVGQILKEWYDKMSK